MRPVIETIRRLWLKAIDDGCNEPMYSPDHFEGLRITCNNFCDTAEEEMNGLLEEIADLRIEILKLKDEKGC